MTKHPRSWSARKALRRAANASCDVASCVPASRLGTDVDGVDKLMVMLHSVIKCDDANARPDQPLCCDTRQVVFLHGGCASKDRTAPRYLTFACEGRSVTSRSAARSLSTRTRARQNSAEALGGAA